MAIGSFVFSQTTDEILQKAREALDSTEYYVDVKYEYEYNIGDSETEKTTINSHFKQFLNGYVQSFDGVLFQVQEDSLLLSVDYEEKFVSLDYSPVQLEIMTYQNLEDYKNEHFRISSHKDGNSYEIEILSLTPLASFEKMTLVYSANDYFITQIAVEYGEVEAYEVSRLNIVYSNKKNLEKRSTEDQIDHYINIIENDFKVLIPELTPYTKINNLWKQ